MEKHIYTAFFAAFLLAVSVVYQGGVSLSYETLSFLSTPTSAKEMPDRFISFSAKNNIIADSLKEVSVLYKKENPENLSKELTVWATAYTSDPDETDDTPFITASGSLTRDGVAAANFLPMGSKFRAPEFFGDKVFIVEDRMNSRFNGQQVVDIWFKNKIDAKEFGRKVVTIELL